MNPNTFGTHFALPANTYRVNFVHFREYCPPSPNKDRRAAEQVRDIERRLARRETLTGGQLEKLGKRVALQDALKALELEIRHPPVKPPAPKNPAPAGPNGKAAPPPERERANGGCERVLVACPWAAGLPRWTKVTPRGGNRIHAVRGTLSCSRCPTVHAAGQSSDHELWFLCVGNARRI